MTVDIGIARDIVTGEPKEVGWYGPFHDSKTALKVFQKLRRQQKYRGKPQLLTGLGDLTKWLRMPATVVEEAIRNSPSQAYSNCMVTVKWYFSPSNFSISVWPMEHRDDSLNKENNWGEEE